MSSVTANDRLSQLGRELRQELSATGEVAGDLFTRAGKLVVEELLKAEVREALGREPGQRRGAGRVGRTDRAPPSAAATATATRRVG